MPQERPAIFDLEVIVDFGCDDGLLFIKVVNIGTLPARRVSVKFEPEIRGLGGSKLMSKMGVFRNIEFLAPGKEISVFVDTAAAYFAGEQPAEIAVAVVYTDAQGKRRTGEIRHDLRIYADIGQLRPAAG